MLLGAGEKVESVLNAIIVVLFIHSCSGLIMLLNARFSDSEPLHEN